MKQSHDNVPAPSDETAENGKQPQHDDDFGRRFDSKVSCEETSVAQPEHNTRQSNRR